MGGGGDDDVGYTQLSEELLVGLTNKGFPEDPTMMGNLNALFADCPRATVRDHLFLVCRVYRIGVLNPDPKAKKQLSDGIAKAIGDVDDKDVVFRRPFGVGVLDLAMIDLHQFEHGQEKEQTMQLFKTPGTEGHGFPDLHAVLMKSGGRPVDGAAEAIAQCTGVVVGVGIFDGPVSELVEHETAKPFDEDTRKNAWPVPVVRRCSDKKMELERNDLFITLESGKFSQDGKKSAKNVEVKGSVLLDTGAQVPCLVRGTGRQTRPSAVYRSCIYYHNNNPAFQETVQLQIPDGDAFERSHLFFLISHCKDDKKTARNPSSFAFLSLTSMDNGVAVQDGVHTLKCYKLLPGMDKSKNLPTYLSMPISKLAEHKVKSMMGGQMGSNCEELTLRLRLVSSKKTQIKELHELINWRQTETHVLQETLLKLQAFAGDKWGDLAKMLREVLDALITLLNTKLKGKDLRFKEALPVFNLWTHILTEFAEERNRGRAPL